MPLRILLADDQQMIREALAMILDLEIDLEVVKQVGRGDEVLPAVRETRPDVALLDIEMPGATGIEAAAELTRSGLRSQTGAPVRSLILTTFRRPGYLRRALEAGASGFVVKDGTASQLAQAVRRTAAGLRVVDSVLAEEAKWQGSSPLTGRETEVLRAAETAGSVKEIAGMLGLSSGTVRNHLSAAMAKIDAINRHEAVRIARDNGWL